MLEKGTVWEFLELDRKAAAAKAKKPTQAAFVRGVRSTGRNLDDLAKALASGDASVQTYAHAALKALEDGHAVSAALGRQRGGDMTPLGAADNLRAAIVMHGENEYLQRFAQQLTAHDSRYWDADKERFDANAVSARSRMYLGKMRGTANAAFVGASNHDDQFDRVMLSAEHCTTCPPKQGGPYSLIQVRAMGIPGDGSDECRGNCGCVLVRYDGVVGFGRYTDPPPGDLTPGAISNPGPAGDVPVIDVDPNDPRLADWFVT